MTESVLLDRTDGIATISLNEPDKMNALSDGIKDAMLERLIQLREDEDAVRCLVVEGEGDAFSAGGDMEVMKDLQDTESTPDESARYIEESINRLVAAVVRFPAPTISKIDGLAVGAGASLAIATDVQLASEAASIGFLFRNVGVSVDAGTSYLLPRLVGLNVAKELVYTGEIVDAERAKSLGLFNRVWSGDAFEENADRLIQTIAEGPTTALRHSKRLIEGGLRKNLEEALRDEAANQGMMFQTRDHQEGLDAFLEGRDPDFEGK